MRADAQRNRVRILDAAEAVFAEGGPDASTEEVARRAGVAIGTVFRHFPTKDDLLAAIMKQTRGRLTERVDELVASGDPDALFTFFTEAVEHAAGTRTTVDALAATGTEIEVGRALAGLGEAVDTLLTQARTQRAVREDVRLDEVLALLTAACQGAVGGGWSADLRHRTVARMLDGLRT